jgi:type II secretory pathway pseudopilin PulG
MIELPTDAVARAALAPYKLLATLVAVIIVSVCLVGLGWKWGASYTRGRQARAEAARVSEYQTSLARARERERAAESHSREVSNVYQGKLSEMAESYRVALASLPPVRVCRVAAANPAGMPGRPDTAGRPNATGAAAAPAAAPRAPVAELEQGADIGPDLVAIVKDGDQCREQLIGLQAWAADPYGRRR